MAVKTIEQEDHWFVPTSERNVDKPFAVFGSPLNKGEYDAYQREFKTKVGRKGNLEIDRSSAIKRIWRNRIKVLRNVYVKGTLVREITHESPLIDGQDAVVWTMLHLADNDIASEIEDWLVGLSTLSPEEEANFTLALGLEKPSKIETESTSPTGAILKPPVRDAETNKTGQEGDSVL